MKKRDGHLKGEWCFRETNQAANWLAGQAMKHDPGVRVLARPLDDLVKLMDANLGPRSRRCWASGGC